MIKVVDDEQFGPVILFGHGGKYAEQIQDTAVALPPLNLHLAREVMSRTRVYKLLKGSLDMPPADLERIALSLVQVSQMICDLAEIAELEINPLLVDASGIVALRARARVVQSAIPAAERLAIRPYPKELEDTITLADGRVLQMRPIRPEDEPGFLTIFDSLTPEDRRLRFLHPIQELPHCEAARLTQIDYDREMALVLAARDRSENGGQVLYGSVRIIADPDNERAEFAILVHREVAGKGLGKLLMRRIIDYARSRGIKEIFGQVLGENIPMLKVCAALGFTSKRNPEEPGVVIVSLRL
jgi:acetyltransferase